MSETTILRHRIYVVDDDEDDCYLIKRVFDENYSDCEVLFFHDGVDVMQHLSALAGGNLPSLILLDLNMPRMDGFEVLKEIKTSDLLKSIPVLILTTSSRREDVMKCYELGTNSFVTKPPNYKELVKLLTLTRTYWLKTARVPGDL